MALEVRTTNGPPGRLDGAELRNGDLEVGEHLEQQALDLDIGLVGLIDEQDGRLGLPDRGQQRPGEQELLGEDVVVGLLPRLVAGRLDPQQLLAVVPLVERARLVEALVALQPHELATPAVATALASSVLPVPAGPSTSSGLPSASARKTVVAIASSAR